MINAAIQTAISEAGWKLHSAHTDEHRGINTYHFRKEPDDVVITEIITHISQSLFQMKTQFSSVTAITIPIHGQQGFLYAGNTGHISAAETTQTPEKISLHYGFLVFNKGTVRFECNKGDYEVVFIEIERAVLDSIVKLIVPGRRELPCFSYYRLPRIDQIQRGLLRQIIQSRLEVPEVYLFRGGKVLELLSRLLKQMKERRNPVEKSTLSSKEIFENYIQERLEEHLGVEDMARHFHMSISTLKQRFAKLFNSPIHQYILQQRLDRARQLLTSSESSVYEVALQSGFTDSSHFIKQFKKRFGLTPLQYKNVNGY